MPEFELRRLADFTLMVALLLGCQRTGQDVPAQIERIVATAIDLTGTLF